MLSLGLVLADYQQQPQIRWLREQLGLPVAGLQYLIDLPMRGVLWVNKSLTSQQDLLQANQQLRAENQQLRALLLKYQSVLKENQRLHELFDSAPKEQEQISMARVLAVNSSAKKRQIVIDKGSLHGLYVGQPVLDSNGVMGQISRLNALNSTVTLITDAQHALQIEITRNGRRTLAEGNGPIDLLNLKDLPSNADVRKGDQLLTSGRDGYFPAGYPVAEVVDVQLDITEPYLLVQAQPYAKLEHNREVLLVWYNSAPITEAVEQVDTVTTETDAPDE